MPVYEVQAPDGKTYEVDGERPPTLADIQRMFGSDQAEKPRRMSTSWDPRLDPAGVIPDEEADAADAAVPGALATYGTMAAGAEAAPAAAGLAGKVGRIVPIASGAIAGGKTLMDTGSPLHAASAAVGGYYGGKGAVGLAGAGRGLLARIGAAAAARAAAPVVAEAVPAAVEAAPAAYRGIPGLMKIAGPAAEDAAAAANAARAAEGAQGAAGIARALPQTAPMAEQAAEPLLAKLGESVAVKTAKAAATKTKGNPLAAFAKEIAKNNPKVGEKIWIELDAAGNPLKVLTPDQAAAAARAGRQTTWVKNLWN